MEQQERTPLYLLSIVGIVAVVGFVVLLLNTGQLLTQTSEEDLTGLATAAKTCTDTDGGQDEFTAGTTSVVFKGTTTDSADDTCSTSTIVTEYYCTGVTIKSTLITCDYGCSDSACLAAEEVPAEEGVDSDADGLLDSEEVEYSTDPNDSDSDDDGLTDGDEVDDYLTEPLDDDSDDDGVDDGDEVDAKTDPTDPSDYLACSETDADAADPYKKKGTVTLVDKGSVIYVGEDTCLSTKVLRENGCISRDTPATLYDEIDCNVKYGSKYVCKNGACVPTTVSLKLKI